MKDSMCNSFLYKYSKYNIVIDKSDLDIVLYNIYSGGLVKIEKQVFDLINNADNITNKIPYFEQLIKNGFIVNKNLDEYQRVKKCFEEMQLMQPKTYSYVIAPTLKCNLNCVYCFQKDYERKNIQISDETIQNIVNYFDTVVRKSKGLEKIKITWFGGEPMICYEQILSLSCKIKECLQKLNVEFETSMITNGTLLDEERIKQLLEIANLKKIQITLDGDVNNYCLKKCTNPQIYYKVLNNIITTSKHLRTIVRFNADKANYNELVELSKYLISNCQNDNLRIHYAQVKDYNDCCELDSTLLNDYEYWVSKEQFYSDIGQDWRKSRKDNLPRFNGKSFCGLIAKNNFVIDYNGNLFKCEHYLGKENKIVGNVIDGLYYNEAYRESIGLVNDERCKECPIFPCCNYSQCVAMHECIKDGECSRFENQLKIIKEKVRRCI